MSRWMSREGERVREGARGGVVFCRLVSKSPGSWNVPYSTLTWAIQRPLSFQTPLYSLQGSRSRYTLHHSHSSHHYPSSTTRRTSSSPILTCTTPKLSPSLSGMHNCPPGPQVAQTFPLPKLSSHLFCASNPVWPHFETGMCVNIS